MRSGEGDGSQWIPYQSATFPTPPFPDYVSGHSTYSAAAARILELWTGSDRFGDSVTLLVGSSKIEPGITPSHPVTLRWETFTDAANEAGISRRRRLPRGSSLADRNPRARLSRMLFELSELSCSLARPCIGVANEVAAISFG
jgi:hypothetical protein